MINNILLIGVGRMGIEYARVLTDMNVQFVPVGRGPESARQFFEKTGIRAVTGGFEKYFSDATILPDVAIVAVNVPDLFPTCVSLMKLGVKRILVEKPGALSISEMEDLVKMSAELKADIIIGYNRRFLGTVLEAKRLLEADGGVLSFMFEFTEWSDRVEVFDAVNAEKERWFLSNSSHIADLAFFLGGKPVELHSFTNGKLKWHPSASAFAGSGITDRGALFSYSANWDAPGRWGVELMSRNLRIILRPLEELHIQKRDSVHIEKLTFEDTLDKKFKPGLYRMVESFLVDDRASLCTLEEHNKLFGYYCQIANYR